jgi:hypothetical protein
MKTKRIAWTIFILLCCGLSLTSYGRSAQGGGNGDTNVICPHLPPPELLAFPQTICAGSGSVLTINATGIRALVVYADFSDGGVTAYLNDDPRFIQADKIDARYYTPSVAEMLEYDVVITWGNFPYESFSAPAPEHNNVSIGNNLKAYVDAGGGVLVCSFGHDSAPDMYFGIGGDFRTYHYNPIVADISQYVYGTVSFGTTIGKFHPITDGVSSVYTTHYYATTSLSAGATAVFYWDNGSLGGAVKTIGSGRVAGLNQSPTYDGGGDENLLIANAAAWAALGVEWFAGSCGAGQAIVANPLIVSPGTTQEYFARVRNICGTVSDCGSITVTVDDENCLDNSSICSYVILTEKEVKLEGCNVSSGGLGATKPGKGKVEAKKQTYITAEGTFAYASQIKVDNTSVISERHYDVPEVALPDFEPNTQSSNLNMNIPDNTTVTLTGSVYKDIKVGKNATVIFTQSDIYAKKITMENNATMDFMQPSRVHLTDGLPSGKEIRINPALTEVVFYIEKDLEFKEGSQVNGVFYLGTVDKGASKLHYKLTIRESKADRPGLYNGMFLAEEVDAKKNNHFSLMQHTGFCADLQPKRMEHAEITVVTEAHSYVKCYPNPSSGRVNIVANLAYDSDVILRVYDLTGKLVETLYHGRLKAEEETGFVFEGNGHPAGIYIYSLNTQEGAYTGRIVLNSDQ